MSHEHKLELKRAKEESYSYRGTSFGAKSLVVLVIERGPVFLHHILVNQLHCINPITVLDFRVFKRGNSGQVNKLLTPFRLLVINVKLKF